MDACCAERTPGKIVQETTDRFPFGDTVIDNRKLLIDPFRVMRKGFLFVGIVVSFVTDVGDAAMKCGLLLPLIIVYCCFFFVILLWKLSPAASQ